VDPLRRKRRNSLAVELLVVSAGSLHYCLVVLKVHRLHGVSFLRLVTMANLPLHYHHVFSCAFFYLGPTPPWTIHCLPFHLHSELVVDERHDS